MRFVEHKTTRSKPTLSDKVKEEVHELGDIDPIIIKKLSAHEKMADEIKKSQIDCEPIELGSHPLERKQYYSQTFSMSPKFVTNRGIVKIKGRNIDYIQLLQRN
ncbi:MAG TPA: hypothetical protein VJ695_04845 [Nitrososphaera sp.]|nr:hypothetical protein [Nitrososphaera sp.]